MDIEIKKVSKVISEEGILSFFSRVIRYIRKNILGVNRANIYEIDLDDFVPKFRSELEISTRLATKEDIDLMDYENYNYNEEGKRYAKERLKKGDSCILAIYNGRIIGYVWISYEFMDISKFNFIPLSKNRACTYNSYVLKEFRGKKVRNSMDHDIYELLIKAGKKYDVGIIDKDNIPSIKNRVRLGFKEIGHVNQIRFFGLKYDYIDKKLLSHLQKP